MKIRYTILLLVICAKALTLSAQESTWQVLQGVTFTNEFDERIGIDVQKPTFGPWVEAIAGKEIEVQGYIIPLQGKVEQSYFMFSALPYNMCFFCGKAGPETAMEVFMISGEKMKFTEDKIWLRGRLELNATSFERPIYALREAVYLSDKE